MLEGVLQVIQQGGERGPGEEAGEEDGEVEPEGLDVLEVGCGEAGEVVFEDEFVEENRAIDLIAKEIPWGGGGHADEGRWQEFCEVVSAHPEGRKDEDEGDEAFGEDGESEEEAGGPEARGGLAGGPGHGEQESSGEGDGER